MSAPEHAIVQTPHRFELHLDGGTAFIDYHDVNNALVMTHTEVPTQFEGQGIGSRLVKFALEAAREQGKQVVPLCPFVAAYIKRHPEYQPLVAE
jgi:hypothetical protein